MGSPIATQLDIILLSLSPLSFGYQQILRMWQGLKGPFPQMSVLSKTSYHFKIISKSQRHSLHTQEKKLLKFTWKPKMPRLPKQSRAKIILWEASSYLISGYTYSQSNRQYGIGTKMDTRINGVDQKTQNKSTKLQLFDF